MNNNINRKIKMKQIQIDFNNNKFLCDLCNDNKDTFIKIEKELRKRYGLKKNQYYITTKHQLINRDWDFNEKYDYCSNYQIHIKVNGGFIDLLIKLVKGILEIAELFVKLPGFVLWVIQVIIWIITELLNPFIFIQDLARSVFAIIKVLISAFLDLFTGVGKYVINIIAAPFINSFWGYTPKREKDSFVPVFNGYKNDNFIIIKKPKNKFDEIFKKGEKILIQTTDDNNFQITTIQDTTVSEGTEESGKTKLIISDNLKYNYRIGSIIAKPSKFVSQEYISSRVKGEFAQITTSNGAEKFVNIKMPQTTFNNNFKIGDEIILQNKNSNTQIAKIVDTSNVSDTETSVTLDQNINIDLSSGSILGKPIRNENSTVRANCNNKTCVQFQNPLKQISGDGTDLGIKIDLSAKSESGLPLSVILLTVLLPPLGLFMELGLKNWINIALCALLTMFYYFPGLIYALIIIYC
jgi:uncharacterized membrane protein YqaE (UPF0057 family)